MSTAAPAPSPAASGAGPGRRRRQLALAFAATGLLGVLVTSVAPPFLGRGVQQLALHEAMTQSQRLAKSVSQAVLGRAAAFSEVGESVEVLSRNLRSLKVGAGAVPALPGGLQPLLDPIMALVERAEKNAAVVLTQQQTLTQFGQALRAVNRQSADLLEAAETVSSLKLQQGASTAEVYAVGQLVMLTQRIGKSANEFLTTEGIGGEAVLLLGKDLNSFREIVQGVLDGNPELRLPGTRDAPVRERLQQLLTEFEQLRSDAGVILGGLQGLVAAREAQDSVIKDSEPLRKGLDELAGRLRAGNVSPWWALVFGLVLVVGIVALAMPFLSPADIRRMLRPAR